MHRDLQQLLDHYDRVLDDYEAGRISFEQAKELIEQSVAVDAAGFGWAVDPDTGSFVRWANGAEAEIADESLFVGSGSAARLGVEGLNGPGLPGVAAGDLGIGPGVGPGAGVFGALGALGGAGVDSSTKKVFSLGRGAKKSSERATPTAVGEKKRGRWTWLVLGAVGLLVVVTLGTQHTATPASTTTTTPSTTTTVPKATTGLAGLANRIAGVSSVTLAMLSSVVESLPPTYTQAGVGVVAGPHGQITTDASIVPGQVSVAISGTNVGLAMRTSSGTCDMALVSERVATAFSWNLDLGRACNATVALGGAGQAQPAYVAIYTVPSSPIGVVAHVRYTSAVVAWQGPASSGGKSIIRYVVSSEPPGAGCASSFRSCSVSGLNVGTSYSFSVVAVNELGASAPSLPSAPVTAITPPPETTTTQPPVYAPRAPSGLVARSINGGVALRWQPVVLLGASRVTSYVVTSTPGGVVCHVSVTTCSTTKLNVSRAYTFQVAAVNAAGSGPFSGPVPPIVISNVPSAPGVVSASIVPKSTSAALSWSPANAEGSTITKYTVTSTPSGVGCVVSTTICVVSGLAYGVSYTFSVSATNARGTGPVSAPSVGVMALTVPGAASITKLLVSSANRAVGVFWANGSTGGTSITSSVATVTPGGQHCSSSATSCTIVGLTRGTKYRVSVTTYNAQGASVASVTQVFSVSTNAKLPTQILTFAVPAGMLAYRRREGHLARRLPSELRGGGSRSSQ